MKKFSKIQNRYIKTIEPLSEVTLMAQSGWSFTWASIHKIIVLYSKTKHFWLVTFGTHQFQSNNSNNKLNATNTYNIAFCENNEMQLHCKIAYPCRHILCQMHITFVCKLKEQSTKNIFFSIKSKFSNSMETVSQYI